MKRLVVEKIVPSITEYIRNFYNKTYRKRNDRLQIYTTGSLRDLALIALCQLAVGKENMNVHCTYTHLKPNLYTKMRDDYLFVHFIPRVSQTFSFNVDTFHQIAPKPHSTELLNEQMCYHLYNLCYMTNRVLSSGFGHCYVLHKFSREHVVDTCLPLYWFSDDEVLQILEHLYWNTELFREISLKSNRNEMNGLCGWVMEGYFEPNKGECAFCLSDKSDAPSFSYQYRDTEFDRALKIAWSDLDQLDKLGQHELFKIKMDHIPRYVDNDLTALTYFFMGESYGCYR